MCVCVFVHPHARMHVVGSFCCICTDVGFSICRLCCYCCVSMEALTHIAALKNQPDLASVVDWESAKVPVTVFVRRALMCVAKCNC